MDNEEMLHWVLVTTFVAEDGQGGHIIISGGAEYQDGSVVSMTGQQVSRVAEGQLIAIASGENAPVSITGIHSLLLNCYRSLIFNCIC